MEPCQQTLKDGRTEQLVSVPKSICNGVAHRLGLIILAIIKEMLNFGLLVILIYFLFVFTIRGKPIWFYHILIWITIFVDVVDIIIGMVIIISVCMKNRKIMKIYYIYSICVFGLLTSLCCATFYLMSFNLVAVLIVIFIFLFVLMIQEFLNHMVKNEVLSLENIEQYQLYDLEL